MKHSPIALLFLNFGFALTLCGCFSSLHQAQVTRGLNASVALRPYSHENVRYEDGILLSSAVRYGWAPSQRRKAGFSIGIVTDFKPSINSAEFPLPRFDFYLQFPKNRILDIGVGAEFGRGVAGYLVLSRKLGRLTFYAEARFYPYPDIEARNGMGTVGLNFEVSKHLSLFNEMNLGRGKWMAAEDFPFPPEKAIGLGIHVHK